MSETAYQPLVSIVINNYNYENFLTDAIESALNQHYPNIEIIVVDDGSTDESKALIDRYGDKIYPIFKENGGQSSALNLGFTKSLGEIICLLDADDVFVSEKVSEVVKGFAMDSTLQWCFHDLQFVDANANPLSQVTSNQSPGKWDYCAAIANGGRVPYIPTATSGLSFRRSFLATICPMPEEIRIASDNYLKFIASALGKGYFMNQPLALQKIHDCNAYTLREDKDPIKAEIVIKTAYWIRVRHPLLSTFANGLMVRGIGMYRKVGQIEAECHKVIKDYFELTRWVEYLTIQMMVFGTGLSLMELVLKHHDNPNVIIYRNHLLRSSETFIREQAGALRNFTPFYVGTRTVSGLTLPSKRFLVVNTGNTYGKFWEYYSQKFGFTPAFLWKLRHTNASLIHAHFAQDAATALPLAKAFGIPLIATFHGFDVTVHDRCAEKTWIQQQYFLRRERLKHSAKLFIAVSDFIKRKAIAQGFPEERIVVHYIGVDAQRFQALPNVERHPVVLFVGRLVEKKGCEYLLQAMQRVQSQMPEMEVVIIGEGPLRSQLEAYAKKHLKRYQFLGVQPPDRVQFWMQRAKLFCVPSVTAQTGDAEGFGMVFAEAQATGLPVVSFASGGIPEAVAHEKTGFLAPERDVDALAFYLQSLLVNPILWNTFSQQGRERVQKQFNLGSQTRLLEEIYRDRVLVSSEKESC